MSTASRVLIADDHALFRDGLRRLLESEDGFEVVGEADDAATTIQLAQELRPDMVILDLAMPGANGLETLESLVERVPTSRVILLSASLSTGQVVKALQIGVRGVAVKDATSKGLFRGMRLVMDGQYWVAYECVNNLVEALRDTTFREARTDQSKDFGLTKRELEIVNLVVAGYSNPEIARKCSISEQTVKHHMSNIFDKVGMYNRVELALFAVSHQIAGNVSI